MTGHIGIDAVVTETVVVKMIYYSGRGSYWGITFLIQAVQCMLIRCWQPQSLKRHSDVNHSIQLTIVSVSTLTHLIGPIGPSANLKVTPWDGFDRSVRMLVWQLTVCTAAYSGRSR